MSFLSTSTERLKREEIRVGTYSCGQQGTSMNHLPALAPKFDWSL
jgi:hypothetical protein